MSKLESFPRQPSLNILVDSDRRLIWGIWIAKSARYAVGSVTHSAHWECKLWRGAYLRSRGVFQSRLLLIVPAHFCVNRFDGWNGYRVNSNRFLCWPAFKFFVFDFRRNGPHGRDHDTKLKIMVFDSCNDVVSIQQFSELPLFRCERQAGWPFPCLKTVFGVNVAFGEILVQVARCTIKIRCLVADDDVTDLAQARLSRLWWIERCDFLAVIQQCHDPEQV